MDGDIDPLLGRSALAAGLGRPAIRVLIVEDDPVIAFGAQLALELAGFAVVGVADTAEAARQLSGLTVPHVALVDLNLADGRTGMEIAAALHRNGTAVVMATGQPEDVERSRSIRAILSKPYSDSAIVAALRDAADVWQRPGG